MRYLMFVMFLVCLAGCGLDRPQPAVVPRHVPNGAVIFWDHGPLTGPIYRHTNSTLTHVAIVLYVGDEPWIYEATVPRVRHVPLRYYYSELQEREIRYHEFSWFILRPRNEFSAIEVAAMKRHADSQLGRRYMLRGWWEGREVRGIMCSQFVGDVLEQSGRIDSAHYHESPGSLYAKLTLLYQ